MIRKDFVAEIGRRRNMTQQEVTELLDTIQDIIVTGLKNGEEVRAFKGMVFTTTEIPAKMGHRPGSNEPLEIPAHIRPKVRFTDAIKTLLNPVEG